MMEIAWKVSFLYGCALIAASFAANLVGTFGLLVLLELLSDEWFEKGGLVLTFLP